MAIAIDVDATHEYVPIGDRSKPKGEQTRFLLKVLKAIDHARVQDFLMGWSDAEGRWHPRTSEAHVKVLEGGLAGWDNFKDVDDKVVSFAQDEPREMIDRIPSNLRAELAREILALCSTGSEQYAE